MGFCCIANVQKHLEWLHVKYLLSLLIAYVGIETIWELHTLPVINP